MRTVKLLNITLMLLFSSCNAQTKKDEPKNQNELNSNLPKKNISVNKEFEKNGNLIKYDSTYSYYYSNIKITPT